MICTVVQGDARAVLPTLAEQSVHCCVTSPPYWGLRDYGHDRAIGLEASLDGWLTEVVSVFREVRRVLRDDGTLWVNVGDAYCTNGKGHSGFGSSTLTKQAEHAKRGALDEHFRRCRGKDCDPKRGGRDFGQPMRRGTDGIKRKDLFGMPWMLAFALRADGWYLRQEIIWAKRNPMPESCTDRPTRSHEQMFLLSKRQRYFYDAAAIYEPLSANTHARIAQNIESQAGSLRANGGVRADRPMKTVLRGGVNPKAQPRVNGWVHGEGSHDTLAHASAPRSKQNASMSAAISGEVVTDRNARSVWTTSTKPYRGNHYATYPPELVDRCIRAGCPAGGVVLDPFAGTGTPGEVALKHGRGAVLVEINPDYVRQMHERLHTQCGLFIADREVRA